MAFDRFEPKDTHLSYHELRKTMSEADESSLYGDESLNNSPSLGSRKPRVHMTPSVLQARLDSVDLIEGRKDWHNIQEVIRYAFGTLQQENDNCFTAVRSLEQKLISKATKESIAQQASVVSLLQQEVDSKVNLDELHSFLKEKASSEDINQRFQETISSVDRQLAEKVDTTHLDTTLRRHSAALAAMGDGLRQRMASSEEGAHTSLENVRQTLQLGVKGLEERVDGMEVTLVANGMLQERLAELESQIVKNNSSISREADDFATALNAERGERRKTCQQLEDMHVRLSATMQGHWSDASQRQNETDAAIHNLHEVTAQLQAELRSERALRLEAEAAAERALGQQLETLADEQQHKFNKGMEAVQLAVEELTGQVVTKKQHSGDLQQHQDDFRGELAGLREHLESSKWEAERAETSLREYKKHAGAQLRATEEKASSMAGRLEAQTSSLEQLKKQLTSGLRQLERLQGEKKEEMQQLREESDAVRAGILADLHASVRELSLADEAQRQTLEESLSRQPSFSDIRSDVQALSEEVKGWLKDKADVAVVEKMVGVTGKQMKQAAEDIARQVEGVASDMSRQVEGVASDMNRQVEGVASDMNRQVEGVAKDVADQMARTSAELSREQIRLAQEHSKVEVQVQQLDERVDGLAAKTTLSAQQGDVLQSELGHLRDKFEVEIKRAVDDIYSSVHEGHTRLQDGHKRLQQANHRLEELVSSDTLSRQHMVELQQGQLDRLAEALQGSQIQSNDVLQTSERQLESLRETLTKTMEQTEVHMESKIENVKGRLEAAHSSLQTDVESLLASMHQSTEDAEKAREEKGMMQSEVWESRLAVVQSKLQKEGAELVSGVREEMNAQVSGVREEVSVKLERKADLSEMISRHGELTDMISRKVAYLDLEAWSCARLDGADKSLEELRLELDKQRGSLEAAVKHTASVEQVVAEKAAAVDLEERMSAVLAHLGDTEARTGRELGEVEARLSTAVSQCHLQLEEHAPMLQSSEKQIEQLAEALVVEKKHTRSQLDEFHSAHEQLGATVKIQWEETCRGLDLAADAARQAQSHTELTEQQLRGLVMNLEGSQALLQENLMQERSDRMLALVPFREAIEQTTALATSHEQTSTGLDAAAELVHKLREALDGVSTELREALRQERQERLDREREMHCSFRDMEALIIDERDDTRRRMDAIGRSLQEVMMELQGTQLQVQRHPADNSASRRFSHGSHRRDKRLELEGPDRTY
ncbi:hypothetical protein CYMTET_48376 [Cymbomonas tetramitiformis]|uniref:Uncharacterized protein n=1 Tax=Cymbomonas tetramitiformis TaxID=36881 RepID=A0AAE0BU13_9CHLO|nr:hypothetical protein CYMTET_48376 [Cymbomonas tetramitiformis]